MRAVGAVCFFRDATLVRRARARSPTQPLLPSLRARSAPPQTCILLVASLRNRLPGAAPSPPSSHTNGFPRRPPAAPSDERHEATHSPSPALQTTSPRPAFDSLETAGVDLAMPPFPSSAAASILGSSIVQEAAAAAAIAPRPANFGGGVPAYRATPASLSTSGADGARPSAESSRAPPSPCSALPSRPNGIPEHYEFQDNSDYHNYQSNQRVVLDKATIVSSLVSLSLAEADAARTERQALFAASVEQLEAGMRNLADADSRANRLSEIADHISKFDEETARLGETRAEEIERDAREVAPHILHAQAMGVTAAAEALRRGEPPAEVTPPS